MAEASFDQLADSLGATWEAALEAEVVDPLEELSAHADHAALGFGDHGADCARGYTGQ
jgi:hypothetical protein